MASLRSSRSWVAEVVARGTALTYHLGPPGISQQNATRDSERLFYTGPIEVRRFEVRSGRQNRAVWMAVMPVFVSHYREDVQSAVTIERYLSTRDVPAYLAVLDRWHKKL